MNSWVSRLRSLFFSVHTFVYTVQQSCRQQTMDYNDMKLEFMFAMRSRFIIFRVISPVSVCVCVCGCAPKTCYCY